MSVVAEVADTTAVMYGGRVMEHGPTTAVFAASAHPYTIGLRNAFPALDEPGEQSRLISIPGAPPDLSDPPSGCRFTARCPFATERCGSETPPTVAVTDDQRAKCHYTDQAASFRERGRDPALWEGTGDATTGGADDGGGVATAGADGDGGDDGTGRPIAGEGGDE